MVLSRYKDIIKCSVFVPHYSFLYEDIFYRLIIITVLFHLLSFYKAAFTFVQFFRQPYPFYAKIRQYRENEDLFMLVFFTLINCLVLWWEVKELLILIVS